MIPAMVFYSSFVASQALYLQCQWHLRAAGAGRLCGCYRLFIKPADNETYRIYLACCTLLNSEQSVQVSDTTDA